MNDAVPTLEVNYWHVLPSGVPIRQSGPDRESGTRESSQLRFPRFTHGNDPLISRREGIHHTKFTEPRLIMLCKLQLAGAVGQVEHILPSISANVP